MHTIRIEAGDKNPDFHIRFANEEGIYKSVCQYEGNVLMRSLRRKKKNKYTLILAGGKERIVYFRTVFDLDKEKIEGIKEILRLALKGDVKAYGYRAKIWVGSFNGRRVHVGEEIVEWAKSRA